MPQIKCPTKHTLQTLLKHNERKGYRAPRSSLRPPFPRERTHSSKKQLLLSYHYTGATITPRQRRFKSTRPVGNDEHRHRSSDRCLYCLRPLPDKWHQKQGVPGSNSTKSSVDGLKRSHAALTPHRIPACWQDTRQNPRGKVYVEAKGTQPQGERKGKG